MMNSYEADDVMEDSRIRTHIEERENVQLDTQTGMQLDPGGRFPGAGSPSLRREWWRQRCW